MEGGGEGGWGSGVIKGFIRGDDAFTACFCFHCLFVCRTVQCVAQHGNKGHFAGGYRKVMETWSVGWLGKKVMGVEIRTVG